MNPMLINPKIDENSDVQTQLKQMRSYLFQFKEQVEMILSNVDKDNLSQSMNTDLDLIRGGIRNYEVKMDGFTSQIAQTAKMISAKLSDGDVDAEFLIQRLNDGSTYSRIKADRINVDGIFTANGSFTVDANGNLIFSGAGIDINTSSTSADIIRLNYGSVHTVLRPGYVQIGADDYSKTIFKRNNSVDPGFEIYQLVGGSYDTSDSYEVLSFSENNGVKLGSSYSDTRIGDGNTTKKIKWKSMHNAYDDDDYVLVGE